MVDVTQRHIIAKVWAAIAALPESDARTRLNCLIYELERAVREPEPRYVLRDGQIIDRLANAQALLDSCY